MTDSQAESVTQAESEAGAGLSRRQEWLVRLGLLVGSLIVFAIFAEIALRLVAPAPEPFRGDAERDPFVFFDHDPDLGWDLVPGARDRHKTSEFDIAIRISEEGLRSDRVYGTAPDFGVRRAVVLGDSFTFGHGVEVEEGWVARVESADDALGMVNLAVTGYGVDQMVLRLEDRSEGQSEGELAFSPDLVIAAIFLADVFRVAEGDHIGYQKPRFVLDDSQPNGLRLTGVPVSKEAAAHADRSAGSQLLRMVRERGVPLARLLGWSEAWPVTEALLGRLKSRAEAGGAGLAVVLIPKDVAVLGSGFRHELNLGAVERLQEMLDGLHVPSLDLTQAFVQRHREAPDEALFYASDGHWTTAGHSVAAEAVGAWLPSLWPEERKETP